MAGETSSGAAPTPITREVDVGFQFQVNVALSGAAFTDVGYFVAVEGLGRRVEPYVYVEGGRAVPHRLFQPTPPGELSLRWGNMERSALWDWMMLVQTGKGFRKDVQILHYTRQLTAVRSIVVRRAWPVEWRGATLSAEETRVAVEEVRLAYDDLEITVNPSAR